MEKSLYEAQKVVYESADKTKGIKVKLRLLDGHFYDDVHFTGAVGDLISIVENGEMIHFTKINGDRIYVNSKLIVDFVLS